MTDFDVGAIVPSTRDLFQVISTRRKNLALLAVVSGEQPADEAARLGDTNVSAFAFAEPGEAMQLGARASKTMPTLCLAAVRDKNDCLRARYFGADGVCIDALLPLEEWDALAKSARMTRMLPLALATDAAGVQGAIKAGARVLLVRASSADEVIALVAGVPRSMTVVGEVTSGDADAIRKLAKQVDAAIVPASVHGASGFAELVAEVDP